MDLWNKLAGTIHLEMTAADPERMLNCLIQNNIELWDVSKRTALVTEFWIKRKDRKLVFRIAEKHGASFRPKGVSGTIYLVNRWLNRPIIVGCVMLLCLLTFLLPERIVFVDVVGNENIPSRIILEEAAKQGLSFGADRRSLRSEKIKNELLGVLEEAEWIGVNTNGCRAVIHVRERDIAQKEATSDVSNLVAAADGIVDEIVMNRGTLHCSPGQAVRKGEILVSGYTDLGICTRVTDPQAEIYALTNRQISVSIPETLHKREALQKKEVKISIVFGKKRINLYSDSGILPFGCAKIIETYPFMLPGGDILPVVLVIQRIMWYDISNIKRTQANAEEILLQTADRYLTQQSISCQILSRQVQLDYALDRAVLQGHFQCREMIARRKAGIFLEGDTQDDSQNSERGAG